MPVKKVSKIPVKKVEGEEPVTSTTEHPKKKLIWLPILIIVLAILFYFAYTYKGLIIAASVNGKPISHISLIKELESRNGKQTLDNIIARELVKQEAKSKNVAVTQDEINSDIKTIEDNLKSQGTTLEDALSKQGLTKGDLVEQITVQRLLEKLLADKIAVADDEVSKYIADNKSSLPTNTSQDDLKSQVKEMLKQQKLSSEAYTYINDLKSKAKINYFLQL